ncbi:MAG: hypothetical protein ACEQSR_08770 [Candidatus Methylacidiphilales bacterium]
MDNLDSIEKLKQAIALAEIKQASDKELLKEQFKITYANLSPANLIKNTFNELTHSDEFKDDILDTAIGLASGYLSKKVIIGNTHNPIKQLFGVVLQMAVTNLVTNHTETIKSTLMLLINKFSNKKDTPE